MSRIFSSGSSTGLGLTQAWLAVSDDPEARVTGQYFYHRRPLAPNPQAHSAALQDRLIAICADLSGILLPTRPGVRHDA